MITDEIREALFRLRDPKFRDLQIRTIPSVNPETIIGVRTPELRKMAKELRRREEIKFFLDSLPHIFFEENQLHAFIISEIKDYPECLCAVNRFLPFVDNWATCDQMSPVVFKNHREELPYTIRQWIAGPATYTVRFGIKMLMDHFLDDSFDPAYPEMATRIRSEEYYIRMMIAWYFATALAKQYDRIVPYMEKRMLDSWTHNKTIQKAVESYRITPEQKEYLRTLKIKDRKPQEK